MHRLATPQSVAPLELRQKLGGVMERNTASVELHFQVPRRNQFYILSFWTLFGCDQQWHAVLEIYSILDF